MRFSHIILVYFVIGATMFGGGAVDWNDAGLTQWFIDVDDSGDVEPTENTQENLTGIAGVLKSIIDAVVGPILLIYNLVVGLIAFIHWPVVVLHTNSAPPAATVLLGGSLNVAFYLSFVRLVRTSA